MLLRSDTLARIRDGSVTLAFRRWRRPTVRTGGTLLTAAGQLQIASVNQVSEADITQRDALKAGFASLEDLLDHLNSRTEGVIYRVEFGGLGPDPRVELRESPPGETELTSILDRLKRLDGRATDGPWTRAVLELIASEPGILAEILARQIGMEKFPFKARVRKLKALGLTISLQTGYRLSRRGELVLARIATTTTK